MKVNFKFYNYYVVYDAFINGEKIIKSIDVNYGSACFGKVFEIFRRIKEDCINNWKIDVAIWCSPIMVKKNKNNYCLLTIEELNYYVKQLKKVFPQDITLELAKEDESKYIIHINGEFYYMEIIMLLTLIRYLFEYPYNCALKDAVVLKMNKKFINVNVLNVFNIIAVCNNNSWELGHCATGGNNPYKFLSYEGLHDTLTSKTIKTCNAIYSWISPTFISKYKKVEYPAILEVEEEFSLVKIFSRYKDYYYPQYKIMQTKEYIKK